MLWSKKFFSPLAYPEPNLLLLTYFSFSHKNSHLCRILHRICIAEWIYCSLFTPSIHDLTRTLMIKNKYRKPKDYRFLPRQPVVPVTHIINYHRSKRPALCKHLSMCSTRTVKMNHIPEIHDSQLIRMLDITNSRIRTNIWIK